MAFFRFRRVLRFSLRGLLIAVTILSIWLGVISNRARVQRAAVEELKQAGARIGFENKQPFGAWVHGFLGDEYGRIVWGVGYAGARRELVDDDLKPLSELTSLRVLYLDPILHVEIERGTFREKRGFEPRCGSFTKEGLSGLGKLTSLTELWVVSKEIDDDVLLAWQSLVNLKTLNVGTPSLSADGIRRFQEAVPQCKIKVDDSAVFWWGMEEDGKK